MRADPFAPGLLHELGQQPRKVALLRASRLGDFICATPAFRALREALPEAELTMITLPILRDLAERLPTLDRYVAFPGFPGLAEQFFDARRALQFFQRMQAERFDLAVQMQGSGVYSNPFTLMLGARVTAGFVRSDDWPGRLDAALPIPQDGHEVDRVLALTDFLGAPRPGTEPEFPLRAEDHAEATALLDGARRPLIGIHPGAWEPRRHWSPERFGAVGASLRRRYGGTVVVMGGPQERFLAKVVAKRGGMPCINLAGQTRLAVLGSVIADLDVLIANNSGPAHVAYAVGTPTVVVFAGSSLTRYGPPHDGPYRLVLGGGAISRPDEARKGSPPAVGNIEEIAVEQVLAAVEQVMPTGQSQQKPRIGW